MDRKVHEHMNPRKIKPRVKRNVLLLLGVYYSANHDGIARYAREANWMLDNMYAHGGLPPTWWPHDGLITLITHPKDYAVFQRFPPRPLVDLSKGWVSNVMSPTMRRAGRRHPRVLNDNLQIARLAAEHFIERGFKHIAFFNFGNFWMETDRIPVFRATVQAAGGQYHEIAYHRHFHMLQAPSREAERSAHLWLMKALRALPKPLGIFVATDQLAITLLRACDEAGLGVPEEVAVLGCDNEALVCDFAPVPMSSVDPDLEQQGYEAAKLLDRLMDGEAPPAEPILIPPRGVVTRQSTDILAVSHAQVARALRFIWEHYHEPIQTPDVATAAGMSRRNLERFFRRHLQRSINAEIMRCRIEHARDLLVKTDLKAHEIAERTGFGGMVQLSRAFLHETGVRPSCFREQHRAGRQKA
jgi:LacI family transcriptional regulator